MNRVKPLIIFKGKGLRISAKERKEYDSRVSVQFQENAWSDEGIMLYWIKSMWNPSIMFTSRKRASRLHLYDVHRNGKSKSYSQGKPVELIPPGTTSKLQPLDTCINSEVKRIIDQLATTHLADNLDLFTQGKCSLSDIRVLATRWIGKAWQEVNRKNKNTLIRSFAKSGIALPVDGSRDGEINIEGLEDYEVGENHDIEDVQFETDSEASSIGLDEVNDEVIAKMNRRN